MSTYWPPRSREEIEPIEALEAYERAYVLGLEHAEELEEVTGEPGGDLPESPLSGEYADSWTPARLMSEIGLEEDSDATREILPEEFPGASSYALEYAELTSTVCDAFEQGYGSSLEERALFRAYRELRRMRADDLEHARRAERYSDSTDPARERAERYRVSASRIIDAGLVLFRYAGSPRYWR